ncbi:MAG TPA: ABC transporter permease [Vicinamibacterales bacterium]|nr:ABC transporter permease [Vicinamibacterales bacterium]
MLIDLRHLLRNFRRSPASAATAVLTLSLTLGVGASIFAVVDAVLLTPPPFADPDALVMLGEILPGEPASAPRTVRYGTVEDWRERAESLASIEAADGTHLTLTELGAAERLHVTDVTPGFLPLLGIATARGRMFEATDLGQPVVILTHALWRTKLAADPAAIGRQIVLGGRAHTVVGVLPEQFVFPLDQVDLFRALPLPADPEARAGYRLGVMARLAGNVSSRDLAAALDKVSRRSSPPAQVVARPISVRIARGSTRTLGLLAGAAALALLIAFANLAGLLLVRSIDRRRELAVRTALGARRSEIARQLLLEAETLVAIGIAGGVLLALWLTPVGSRLVLEPFGDLANREVAVSWRVIAVVAMVAAACAGFCGLLPAFVASRNSVVDVLARGVTPAPRELGLRRVFATGVIALACVLLVSLTLVGRSLSNVLNVNPGFDARGVLTLPLLVQYPNPERTLFLSALHSALEARLGPRTVSVVNELPLTHDGGRRFMRIRPTDPAREVVLREAGPAYFDVMRIPIVAGRPFDARDNAAAPSRVVVSKSLAEQWFPGEQPIGHQISLGPGPRAPMAEIIGIADDVKHRSLDAEGFWPTVYASVWQESSSSMILVVRSQRSDTDVVAAVREEVARLDRDVPVLAVRSMQDVAAVSPGVPTRRVLTATFMGFALLAIVLGGIGLFGVVAHDVASRRAELALRLALGADPMRILIRTLGQGAWMVGAGLVVGGVLSIWATGALSAFVFATGRFDPLNVAVVAAVLMAVGAVAVLPAARRAARIDPVSALRSE